MLLKLNEDKPLEGAWSTTVLYSSGNRYSWRDLGAAVRAVQSRLRSNGLVAGDTIALRLHNSVAYVVMLLAGLSMGYRVAVLNPDTPAQTLREFGSFAQVKLFLGGEDKSSYEQAMKQAIQQQTTGARSDFWITEELYEQTEGGILQLSSGSTGLSKMVFRSTQALIAEGKAYKQSLSMHSEDVILAALPLFHSYPQGFCLFGWLAACCRLIVLQQFRPAVVCSYLKKEAITLLPLVPVTARLLVESPVPTSEFPSLRCVMVGAGAVTAPLDQAFREKFGIALTGNYGSTETGAMCVRFHATAGESGFEGTFMPSVEMQVRSEDGHPMPFGATGHLWARTPAMLSGYVEEKGGLTVPTDSEGWLYMGDYGHSIPNGVMVEGRSKMLVDRGGVKINPSKIETVLSAHSAIQDVIAFGENRNLITSEERLLVCVSLYDQGVLTVSDIRTYLKERLTDLEIPDVIHIVSRIPYTPNHKPDYRQMRQILTEARSIT